MNRMLRAACTLAGIGLLAATQMGGCDWYNCNPAYDKDCPPHYPAVQILDAGDNSCVAVPSSYKAQAFVFHSQLDWDRFWNDHVWCLGPPAPPAPAVAFSHQTLVAVVCSERPTTGYTVRVDTASAFCDSLEITAVETQPGPACVVLPTPTRPYQFIVVEGTFTFFVFSEYFQEVVDCP